LFSPRAHSSRRSRKRACKEEKDGNPKKNLTELRLWDLWLMTRLFTALAQVCEGLTRNHAGYASQTRSELRRPFLEHHRSPYRSPSSDPSNKSAASSSECRRHRFLDRCQSETSRRICSLF
jgi:hypothetical protein